MSQYDPALDDAAREARLRKENKKPRRYFPWVFLAIQLLFVIWIVSAIVGNSGDPVGDCGSLSQQACNDAESVGTGIGVALVVILWLVVDFILAITYLVFKAVKR